VVPPPSFHPAFLVDFVYLDTSLTVFFPHVLSVNELPPCLRILHPNEVLRDLVPAYSSSFIMTSVLQTLPKLPKLIPYPLIRINPGPHSLAFESISLLSDFLLARRFPLSPLFPIDEELTVLSFGFPFFPISLHRPSRGFPFDQRRNRDRVFNFSLSPWTFFCFFPPLVLNSFSCVCIFFVFSLGCPVFFSI